MMQKPSRHVPEGCWCQKNHPKEALRSPEITWIRTNFVSQNFKKLDQDLVHLFFLLELYIAKIQLKLELEYKAQ